MREPIQFIDLVFRKLVNKEKDFFDTLKLLKKKLKKIKINRKKALQKNVLGLIFSLFF